VIAELDALYLRGWRGRYFLLTIISLGIGEIEKRHFSLQLLSGMRKKNPFYFSTEVSINLADDDTLMQLMVKAEFEAVFIGIESPNEESLIECNKTPE